MEPKKRKSDSLEDEKVAPTMNEEDSYGEDATEEEVEHGNSTKVTRLVNDEIEPS
ncbi:hypothetical protein [Pontibacillus yanchengensis]|uniref:hypothetical protein n=1 Tax=Pontibacillus yanchengensis TaxID=462910 RepID=UPI001927A4BB|nr:hypothetical protein [Pontibacillus yanchengensis]